MTDTRQPPQRRVTKAQRVKALSDIWAFADIIDFQGGSSKFASIHQELAEFVTAPQEAETLEDVIDDERRRVILMPRVI